MNHDRIRDLLERELNGEITASETLELERAGEDVAMARRAWRDVTDGIGVDEGTDRIREAQVTQGVMRGLRLREGREPGRVAYGRWPAVLAGGLALGFMVAMWVRPAPPMLRSNTPPVSVVTVDAALVSRARPVEVEVHAVDDDADPPLVTVTF